MGTSISPSSFSARFPVVVPGPDVAATDNLGRFSLLVFRENQFQPAVLDTARVYVKGYPTVIAAKSRGPAEDSLPVIMTFAPMGTPVDTTEAELMLSAQP